MLYKTRFTCSRFEDLNICKHLIAAFVLAISAGYVNAAPKYHFAFFIPDDTPFWSRVALFATSAAQDLDIKLTIFDANANRIF